MVKKEKFEFSFKVNNSSIKNIYIDPNAFGVDVKFGDEVLVVVHESEVPEKFFDKGTPFQIELDETSLTLWFDIIPEKILLNGKVISEVNWSKLP